MKDLSKLKKGNLFNNGPYIYEIIENNTAGRQMIVQKHHIMVKQQKIEKEGTWRWPYMDLEKHRPFMNAIEMDDDVMQGFIMGIFGEGI
jgi:hypothetical protein